MTSGCLIISSSGAPQLGLELGQPEFGGETSGCLRRSEKWLHVLKEELTKKIMKIEKVQKLSLTEGRQ